jgi:tRNA (guanine-N7-)-methyltransferase
MGLPPYISLEPLMPWLDLRRPLAWNAFFPESTRLHVEIGFGLGDFLVRQALAHPHWGIVGIETGWMPIRRTLRKIGLAKVSNAKLVRVDARVALERLFEDGSISSLDSLFPCPWPKKRHFRYRLFSTDFLTLMNSRLVSGGNIRIVTDHKGYFEWMVAQATGTGFDLHRQTIPPICETKYERKWQDLGQEHFYELRLVKKNHQSMLIKEDIPLQTRLIRRFNHEEFKPSGSREKIVVEFKDYIFDPVRRRAMLRTLVIEDSFKQDFWIEICDLKGAWHIRPAKGCGLIPTVGAQQALDLVWEAAKRQNK